MKLYKNEAGFTLIEILIVVLIIGIIAALAIPNLMSAQKTAWGKTCDANSSTMTAAAELYRIQSGGTLPTIDQLTSALSGYEAVMNSIPDCPAGGKGTTVYKFASTSSTTVECSDKGTKHP